MQGTPKGLQKELNSDLREKKNEDTKTLISNTESYCCQKQGIELKMGVHRELTHHHHILRTRSREKACTSCLENNEIKSRGVRGDLT